MWQIVTQNYHRSWSPIHVLAVLGEGGIEEAMQQSDSICGLSTYMIKLDYHSHISMWHTASIALKLLIYRHQVYFFHNAFSNVAST